jgi:ParB/RepB/Spo0J family partition protein
MMREYPVSLPIEDLDPHPKNPRLTQREDVVEAIRASINGSGFDPAHALIARPLDGRFQILSGHHRFEAAKRAGLDEVSVWVRPMDDEAAYMELVRSNAQSELTALERGLHALHSGMDVKAYAESVGRKQQSVSNEVLAARVREAVPHVGYELSGYFRHLTEIHAAPRWLWPALVENLVSEDLTVAETREAVSSLKDFPEPPAWMASDKIATALVEGAMKGSEIEKMASARDRALAALEKAGLDQEHYKMALLARIDGARPGRLAELLELCQETLDAQAAAVKAEREKEVAEERTKQERESRISSLRANVSLEAWKTLDVPTRGMLLDLEGVTSRSTFNEQKNAEIEWAQFSWNPVTGCLHDCPYCYARDIATGARMEKVYPNGFAPTFRPASLLAPRNTKVPEAAATDTRYRNVFTCSMADLFGRWVPAEWINAVLDTVRSNPQWNFLFLTKFPKRMAEFDIPDNAWMGTTVDLQVRVRAAEEAFSRVKAGIRWLSVEPMLEPLKFERLDLFQWIVIGGASPSSQTPAWKPPFRWVADLERQAREAGLAVYQKTNCLGSRVLELPFDAPVAGDPQVAPDVFHYLGRQKEAA